MAHRSYRLHRHALEPKRQSSTLASSRHFRSLHLGKVMTPHGYAPVDTGTTVALSGNRVYLN